MKGFTESIMLCKVAGLTMLSSGFFGEVFRRDDQAGSWVSVSRDGPAFAGIRWKEGELSRGARRGDDHRFLCLLLSIPRPLGAVSATFRTQQGSLVGLESMVLPRGVCFTDERQCSFFLPMFAKCVQCPIDWIRIHWDNKQAEGGSMSF